MQAAAKSTWIAIFLGGALFAGDLFPLKEGNIWTYREPRFGGSFTIKVGAGATVNGQTYHTLTGYVPREVLVRVDDQSRLVYVDPDSGQESVLTYFTPPDGEWWDAPLRMCGERAQTMDKSATHDGAMGVVNGVVELQYQTLTCADAGDLSEQYAENIGMVRRVTQSFTGPRQYDLIHAKVGGIVIESLPFARFGVVVDRRSNASSVMATMRLETTSGSPLKLEFGSGQEYDLVLVGTDGKVLWKWSTGRAFIESLHARTVNSEWSTTVEVPRPIGIPETGPVTYTLQAWLTTMGDTPPKFSASIPVTFGQ